MGRVITIAAAQLGPVPRDARRGMVVERMLALMEKAARAHATLIVFPELALTTFFPRWAIDDDAALDGFFEAAMPGPETELLFAAARQLRLGLCFGYGELAKQGGRPRRFNSSALIGADGGLIGHYRKVHRNQGLSTSTSRSATLRPEIWDFRSGAPSVESSAC